MFAASSGGVLVPCFLIAAVIVTPYALKKRRELRELRNELSAPVHDSSTESRDGGEPDGPAPRLEDLVDSIAGLGADGAETVCLEVPAGVTVDGVESGADVADVVLRDALRRSGWIPVAETETDHGRKIECRRLDVEA